MTDLEPDVEAAKTADAEYQLSASSWQRASRDLRSRSNHTWFYILSGLAGALGAGFAQTFGDDPIVAILIGIAAALVPITLLFVYLLIVAPYAQRDEARSAASHYQQLAFRTDQTRIALDIVDELRTRLTSLGEPDPDFEGSIGNEATEWTKQFFPIGFDAYMGLRRNGFLQLGKPFLEVGNVERVETEDGFKLVGANRREQYIEVGILLDESKTRLLAELGESMSRDPAPTTQNNGS
jgi:hypothetical protein